MSNTNNAGEEWSGPQGELLRAAWKIAVGFTWFQDLYGAPSSHFGVEVCHYPVAEDGNFLRFDTDLKVTLSKRDWANDVKVLSGVEMLQDRYENLIAKELKIQAERFLSPQTDWGSPEEYRSMYKITFSHFPDRENVVKGYGPAGGFLEDVGTFVRLSPSLSSSSVKPESVGIVVTHPDTIAGVEDLQLRDLLETLSISLATAYIEERCKYLREGPEFTDEEKVQAVEALPLRVLPYVKDEADPESHRDHLSALTNSYFDAVFNSLETIDEKSPVGLLSSLPVMDNSDWAFRTSLFDSDYVPQQNGSKITSIMDTSIVAKLEGSLSGFTNPSTAGSTHSGLRGNSPVGFVAPSLRRPFSGFSERSSKKFASLDEMLNEESDEE